MSRVENLFIEIRKKFFSFLERIGIKNFSNQNRSSKDDDLLNEDCIYVNREKAWLTSHQIFTRQLILAAFFMIIAVMSIYIFFSVGSDPKTNNKRTNKTKSVAKEKINVEVASKALDPDRMWRNHFEDKLSEVQETTKLQLNKIAESIDAKSNDALNQTKDDINELKELLKVAREDLESAAYEMREMRFAEKNKALDIPLVEEPNLQSEVIENEMDIRAPRDSKMYIPETSYVTGILLGGISVSTSVSSSAQPVPVVIRVTGNGNLPQKFNADLSSCRILGSSYGDLSSERVVIRAEVLVCENKESEEIITTKIVGLIYGDDGMNGIKGKVIDMSTKNIKNAAIGGMISGLAGTMKAEGQFTMSSLGAINLQQQDFNGRLKDNALTGAGTAAEKIANYYIRQAENMSPVLLIPAATKVDIVFTKGVYLGSLDVVKKLESERKAQARDIN